MRAYDLILKKRQGHALSTEEIQYLIEEYTKGSLPDYQMAALCMAIYFQGMSEAETADLTMSMVHSGEVLDLSAIEGAKIDKHSTGGVGDTTTLVLAPWVASCGVPVAKMSGRGLGHTGGTIDKLESIPGFRTDLTNNQFIQQVNSIKAAVMGQTAALAPADKLLYALRDVTATVESIPLIASSIMSKKIAAGADGFVLDVKTGRGAFMAQLDDAQALARTMVAIGRNVSRRTVALVTDMSQPLGLAIGNALEVNEAVAALQGNGPNDLLELCLALGTEMLLLADRCADADEAADLMMAKLRSGEALERFGAMIAAQGGDAKVIADTSILPQAEIVESVTASQAGFVIGMDPLELGLTAMTLGAGRSTKESVIYPEVGLQLVKKVGDAVQDGGVLAYVHARDRDAAAVAKQRVNRAFELGDKAPAQQPHIFARISPEDLD